MTMNFSRRLATAVVTTAIAVVGSAPTAHAEPPPFNGTYTGGDTENFWTVSTACQTDGCTGTVASNQGWSVPATLTNGVWTFLLTKPDGVICADGTYAPAYIAFAVDPATLNGTITNDSNYSCPGGKITQNSFTLKKIG